MSLERRLERLVEAEAIVRELSAKGRLPFYQAVDAIQARMGVRRVTAKDYVDVLRARLKNDSYYFLVA